MDSFDPIREGAVAHRDALHLDSSTTSTVVVRALLAKLDIELTLLPPGDPGLVGARAIFDEQMREIFAEMCGDDAEHAALIAHEVGHAVLHSTSTSCTRVDVDPSLPTEMAPVGVQRIDSYGARERRELQANVFARELLLPRRLAYSLHVDAALSATAIAERLRLPKNLVRQQILDSLLLPAAHKTATSAPPEPERSDPKQDAAARHRDGAFLLQAGPGTGKTRTLVKRVQSLLDEQTDPASMLILTYSNRAAAELFERIAKSCGDAASKMWIGTLHAFGLELVRRYHDRLGLSSDPTLFDRSDAVDVLEDLLLTLPLVHFRNLWDPVHVLKDVLTTISRAKDEMTDAAGYRALALAMATQAGDDDRRKKAEKCLEVATIYEQYQVALAKRDAVDFGDLIMRPALLLESDANVRRELRLRHRHVLVDEYQDVNLASTRLVRALAGEGDRLWAVGDARQSIYRFRGASSGNMRSFGRDYPGAKTDALDISYRSSREIVDVVTAFSVEMAASRDALPLKLTPTKTSPGTRPEIHVCESNGDEAAAVAEAVRELEKAGVPLREQAVLCRTNRRVDEMASALESRGIAVLHLGSFFEREDVRDVLALMSLVVDRFGAALARVAALPRYALSLQDVFVATQCLGAQTRGFVADNLAIVEADPRLSAEGRRAVARLREDLVGFNAGTSPWEFVTTYLFDRTSHLAALGRLDHTKARTRAIALWQLLTFLRQSWPPRSGPPIQRVLEQVRRLVLLAEDRDLRHLPPGAGDLDAVRLLTMHASKGLEFEAVHIPGLGVASVPSNFKGARCPTVDGLVAASSGGTDDARAAHDEEEECLFFVAMSRAKRRLRLYRAKRQPGGNARNPSRYLARLPLSEVVAMHSGPTLSQIADPTVTVTWPTDYRADALEDLSAYERCPRRFFYKRVLGLRSPTRATAFARTERCLVDLIGWLANARTEGEVSKQEAKRELDRIWTERGPTDHAYAADYRAVADRLADALIRCSAGGRHRKPQPLAVPLRDGVTVSFAPTEIEQLDDGTVIVRLVRTGRRRSDEYERLHYALARLGARFVFGAKARVQVVHLESENIDELDDDALKEKAVEKKRAIALALDDEIRSGRYPANPDAFTCARCPYFFICDATPGGALDLRMRESGPAVG